MSKARHFENDIIKAMSLRRQISILVTIVGLITFYLDDGKPPKSAPENAITREDRSAATVVVATNENLPLPTASTTTITVEPTPLVMAEAHYVNRVIDGDTIEIETGEIVRYIGIDTPETVHPTKTVQCFGKEASDYNKQLVYNKMVILEKDVSDKDRYGRLLRYVYVGHEMINERLAKEGYARSATFPPDVKYAERFLEAQTHAQTKQLGLWSKCE